jgi:hypothetical protein
MPGGQSPRVGVILSESESKEDIDEATGLGLEDLAAMQMHHSVHTGLRVYGRQGDDLTGLAINQQQALVDFSLKYHEFFKISRDDFQQFMEIYISSVPAAIRTLYDQNRPSDGGVPSDRGVSADSAALAYRLKPKVILSQSESSASMLDQVKIRDLALYLGSDWARPDFQAPAASESSDQVPEELYDSTSDSDSDIEPLMQPTRGQGSLVSSRHWFPSKDPLLSLLRDFLNDPSGQFRSPGQRRGLFFLLRKVAELIVVLPTAGGKSTLFLLAGSLSESRVNLIIVPLVALKTDLYQKAMANGIPTSIWENLYKNTPPTPIVLVSVESVMHLDFLGWCQSLISEGKLDRIIIDECHLVPEADSYRKYMREVFHLRKLAIPLVLTTATPGRMAKW